jgi:hypothetical protein
VKPPETCSVCGRWCRCEAHHLAGRAGGKPRHDLTIPVCPADHRLLSRWQITRRNAGLRLGDEMFAAWWDVWTLAVFRAMPDAAVFDPVRDRFEWMQAVFTAGCLIRPVPNDDPDITPDRVKCRDGHHAMPVLLAAFGVVLDVCEKEGSSHA